LVKKLNVSVSNLIMEESLTRPKIFGVTVKRLNWNKLWAEHERTELNHDM